MQRWCKLPQHFMSVGQESCSHKPYNRLASEGKFMYSSKWEKENLAAVAINKLWNMGCHLGSSGVNEKLYSQAELAMWMVLYTDIYISKRKGILAVASHISLVADAKTVVKDLENLRWVEVTYLGRRRIMSSYIHSKMGILWPPGCSLGGLWGDHFTFHQTGAGK